MADDQVRNGIGWHHHIALSMLARWFLIGEALRGKKHTPALTIPRLRALIASVLEDLLGYNRPATARRRATRWLQRNERARFFRYRALHLLPPLKIERRL